MVILKTLNCEGKVSKVIEDEGKNGKYYQILMPVKKIFHDSEHLESNPLDFGEPVVQVFSPIAA